MNIYEFAPIAALINGAHWVVTTLSSLLEPIAGQAGAAIAVILLTVIVRIVLIPVGRSQVKADIARRRLAPRLQELQKKYKKNPETLQRKMMELYREEKTSPTAGCLPVLAQTPVLMAVYGLFILPTIGGQPNDLLTHTFLGIPLGESFAHEISTGSVTLSAAVVHVVIMVVIAVVAQLSRRLIMQPAQQQAQATQPERQPGMPDLSGLTKVLSFMPFMTAIIAAFVPLAAALYLMTTTAWTLGERLILRRLLGADRAPAGPEPLAA